MADRCKYVIDGPKVGRNVVLWRKQCRNRTNHQSGYCHVHRPMDKDLEVVINEALTYAR